MHDPERRVAERYGIGEDGGLLLIRPDGYVGLEADLGDAVLTGYLDRTAGG